MTVTAGDPFLGVCRVSRDRFVAALRERPANTACLTEGDPGRYWSEARAWGLDPCFLLAMFAHESSMGRAGVAQETRSWGNTRSPSFGAVHIDSAGGRSGEFPVFASWLDGAASTAARLASLIWPRGAPYGDRPSILQVFEHPSGAVWAPAGDLNDPDGYLAAMLTLMNGYSDQEDEWIVATRTPTPPVYSAYLTINYSPGRDAHPIGALILHITGGASAAGCINWFKNPASQVSSHYVIDRDGTIFATVREHDTAWVNGIVEAPNMSIPIVSEWVTQGINPNLETIGIEVAGYSDMQPDLDHPELNGYTEAQFAALAFLLPALSARYEVGIDPDEVFGHCEISGTQRENCPGLSGAEWERVYALGAAGYATADEAFNAWLDARGDDALWAGQIVGKQHWYGRDPQELCRTVSGRLLAYDGAVAQDATGWQMDEWQEISKAVGQLQIWGEG